MSIRIQDVLLRSATLLFFERRNEMRRYQFFLFAIVFVLIISPSAFAGWASKLHFTTAPCYYHNYMLGELLASQLHNHIVHKVLTLESDEGVSYVGDRRVGDYLRRKVLGLGALYHWNEMITRATGEPLTPKYFVEQFVK